MNIGIDIDDTISNTYDISIKWLKREIIPDLSKAVNDNYIIDAFGLSSSEEADFWEKYWEKILNDIKPKEDAVNIINKLKSDENRIVIITARWDMCGISAFEVSKEWLKRNNICFDELIVNAQNKADIASDKNIDYFIDDSIKNCEEVSQRGIKSYLFSAEINKHYNSDSIKKVYSWKEIYENIKEEV